MLNLTEEEEKELLAYDKAVENGERTDYDLTPEQQKTAKKYTATGTRKAPTVYKFNQPKRKQDTTKEGLISALAEFLQHTEDFNIEDLTIPNKSRMINFKFGDNYFDLTLVRKNKNKKGD